jgi:hypothetical protein
MNNLGWKILFATENHADQQVENDIPIENVSHVLTPLQLSFQIILIGDDINCYS